jgi:hypothetical protein
MQIIYKNQIYTKNPLTKSGSFGFAKALELCVGAKANVPFLSWSLNFKIFARGQSPDRRYKVFLSR